MLDVLNERLIHDGERAIAFDRDCREGICGSCSLVIDGIAARAAAGDELPDLHARLRRRRRDHGRAVPQQRLPGHPRPRRRPLAARPDRRGRRLHLVDAGPKPEPNSMPVHPEDPGGRRWTRRSASAAAPASPPARTARRCCSPAPRSPTSTSCRRASPSATTARGMVRQHGRRGLRRLHQLRRVPGGLPAGDLDQGDRRAIPRVPRGDGAQAARPARHAAGAVRQTGWMRACSRPRGDVWLPRSAPRREVAGHDDAVAAGSAWPRKGPCPPRR